MGNYHRFNAFINHSYVWYLFSFGCYIFEFRIFTFTCLCEEPNDQPNNKQPIKSITRFKWRAKRQICQIEWAYRAYFTYECFSFCIHFSFSLTKKWKIVRPFFLSYFFLFLCRFSSRLYDVRKKKLWNKNVYLSFLNTQECMRKKNEVSLIQLHF